MNLKDDNCIPAETLGEVLALPEGDRRRAHLDHCPRCQALAVSYRTFVSPADEAGAAYGTLERDALDRFRARLIAPGAGSMGRRAVTPSPRPSGWARLWAPAMRPAWALAAVAVVLGAVMLRPSFEPSGRPGAVRGAVEHALDLGPEQLLPGGAVRLSWRSSPEADRYEVRFLSSGFAELGRRDAQADTSVTLALDELPEAYRNGELVLYRVHAIHGPDDVDASVAGTLPRAPR